MKIAYSKKGKIEVPRENRFLFCILMYIFHKLDMLFISLFMHPFSFLPLSPDFPLHLRSIRSYFRNATNWQLCLAILVDFRLIEKPS